MDGIKRGRGMAILGFSLGILDIVLVIFPLVIALITLGFGLAVFIPLMSLGPVGMAGLIVSLVASSRLQGGDLRGQKFAKLGIVFNLVGTGIGILLLTLLILAMSGIFGQWY